MSCFGALTLSIMFLGYIKQHSHMSLVFALTFVSGDRRVLQVNCIVNSVFLLASCTFDLQLDSCSVCFHSYCCMKYLR